MTLVQFFFGRKDDAQALREEVIDLFDVQVNTLLREKTQQFDWQVSLKPGWRPTIKQHKTA